MVLTMTTSLVALSVGDEVLIRMPGRRRRDWSIRHASTSMDHTIFHTKLDMEETSQ
jgi:hypothetical protein